jgi:hypothetical protein
LTCGRTTWKTVNLKRKSKTLLLSPNNSWLSLKFQKNFLKVSWPGSKLKRQLTSKNSSRNSTLKMSWPKLFLLNLLSKLKKKMLLKLSKVKTFMMMNLLMNKSLKKRLKRKIFLKKKPTSKAPTLSSLKMKTQKKPQKLLLMMLTWMLNPKSTNSWKSLPFKTPTEILSRNG